MITEEVSKFLITIALTSTLAVITSLYAHLRLVFACKSSLRVAEPVYKQNLLIEKWYPTSGYSYMEIDVANNVLFWVNKCLLLPTTTTTANHLHYLKASLLEYRRIKSELIKLPVQDYKKSQQIKDHFLCETVSCIAYMKLLSFISPFETQLIRSWVKDSPDDLQIFVDKCVFGGVDRNPQASKDNP